MLSLKLLKTFVVYVQEKKELAKKPKSRYFTKIMFFIEFKKISFAKVVTSHEGTEPVVKVFTEKHSMMKKMDLH
jgi:hypothetical protein